MDENTFNQRNRSIKNARMKVKDSIELLQVESLTKSHLNSFESRLDSIREKLNEYNYLVSDMVFDIPQSQEC